MLILEFDIFQSQDFIALLVLSYAVYVSFLTRKSNSSSCTNFRKVKTLYEALATMDPPQALSPNLLAIKVTERVNSCISILGIAFILFTYIFYPTFRKPINRLIFFASWGNLGLNVAGLISIDSYLPAKNDALCKAQGFMVQM